MAPKLLNLQPRLQQKSFNFLFLIFTTVPMAPAPRSEITLHWGWPPGLLLTAGNACKYLFLHCLSFSCLPVSQVRSKF